MADIKVKLLGYVVIKGIIQCVEGLHIGSSEETIEIGGIDSLVIKNPVTNQPYIPGSSLKGKLRSTLEKFYGLPLHQLVNDIYIHDLLYDELPKSQSIIRTFGGFSSIKEKNGERKKGDKNFPARLKVRDSKYSLDSVKEYMENKRPITEAKTETAIDRITSAAHPRTIERVPAGAEFSFELIYKIQSVNESLDGLNSEIEEDLKDILLSMEIIEKYSGLGGNISRGSGKVQFYFTDFIYDNFKIGPTDILKEWKEKNKPALDAEQKNEVSKVYPSYLDIIQQLQLHPKSFVIENEKEITH